MHKPYCDVLRARARQILRLSRWVGNVKTSSNLNALAATLVTDANLLDSNPVIAAVNTMPDIARRFDFPDGAPSRRATSSQGSC